MKIEKMKSNLLFHHVIENALPREHEEIQDSEGKSENGPWKLWSSLKAPAIANTARSTELYLVIIDHIRNGNGDAAKALISQHHFDVNFRPISSHTYYHLDGVGRNDTALPHTAQVGNSELARFLLDAGS